MELNIQLLKLRQENNLTLKEASKKSGINEKTINNWEVESTGAGYYKLNQYLQIYGKQLAIK